MRQISRRYFEVYGRVKKPIGENELSKEDLKKHINSEVYMNVSSKGMERSMFKSLSEASTFIGVSRQTL